MLFTQKLSGVCFSTKKFQVKSYSGVCMGVINFVCFYYHVIYTEISGASPPSPQSPYYQDRVHKLSSLRCVSYHVICIRVIVVWFNNSSHPYPHRQSYQDWVHNLSCLRCMSYHVICIKVIRTVMRKLSSYLHRSYREYISSKPLPPAEGKVIMFAVRKLLGVYFSTPSRQSYQDRGA